MRRKTLLLETWHFHLPCRPRSVVPHRADLFARRCAATFLLRSPAYLRMRSASPADQRVSIRTLRPSIQPNCWRPCTNAARRACPSVSSAAVVMSTPMRRIRSPCCARAASGPRGRRATEQRDELAPSQAKRPNTEQDFPSHAVPPSIIPANGSRCAAGLPQVEPANGRSAGPWADLNCSELSRLLISQDFLPRSVPNRHLRDTLGSKGFFRTSVPNIALSRP